MSTRRSKSTNRNDDAIAMLMQDHKRVQKLFREFERLDHDDPEACRELVELACTELKVHTTLEEEIFYPAVRKAFDEDDEALLDEAGTSRPGSGPAQRARCAVRGSASWPRISSTSASSNAPETCASSRRRLHERSNPR
jgi:hypothetical protein